MDVLVIGSGPAGLAAAWEAREAGRSVLVLEASGSPGGAGICAPNYLAFGTSYRRSIGVTDSAEAVLKEWTLGP